MNITAFYSDGLPSNSYLLTNGGDAVLIDCAVPVQKAASVLEKNGAELRYIVLTHGHFDHICTLDEMKKATGASVVIHRYDAEMLADGQKNGYCAFFSGDFSAGPADITAEDGDTIKAGGIVLRAIHTPGHTKGSMCLECGDFLFTGDTLFAGNIGRCDLYGGDERQMMNSIKILAGMEPSLNIYPGHGAASTMERELSTNYYIRDALENN